MQDAGHLIATYFLLLYTILGPLVLFAVYVLFDALAEAGEGDSSGKNLPADKNEPALWTKEDIDGHLNRL